jgi:hypothetical protein
VAFVFGVEGGHVIEDSLDNLRVLYDRDALYLTLAWTMATIGRDHPSAQTVALPMASPISVVG